MPDDIVLDRDRAVLVHRVAREALVNATKHSSAQSVEVRVRQSGMRTRITVSDDGVGFDTTEPRPDGHFGLRILADTVRQAGGSLHISSAPGHGTSVAATFGESTPAIRPTARSASEPLAPGQGRDQGAEAPDHPGR
ncbi:ATP-binding protein [Arthrobacter sp. SX1312]|uniref:ATP-binding protein n=1 Tax=Arthrobacter sp. SX1312 TaxID=2058896 RepID=UPI0011B093E7